MNRDRASLIDIVNAANRILAFAQDIDKSVLATNEEKQSAILYQVIIIGEAVKRLSPEFRDRHSQVPWKDIAGMRDILAHQYDKVDFKTVWDVASQDIPELLTLIEPLLQEFE